MAEQVYALVLGTSDYGHGGSKPSAPTKRNAGLAELADALDSKPSVLGCASSSLAAGTNGELGERLNPSVC